MSDTLSLPTIVEGRAKVDMGEKNIAFGSYVMVNIGTMNTLEIRFVPKIELKASNNYGEYYFMNIFTGKKMHS